MSENIDPTVAIRLAAAQLRDVVEGTSCSQTSFKTGGKAFLYIGEHGGRYKAMFKLSESKTEAAKLAEAEPENYQVGNTAWVTARFSAEQPLPKKLWQKWLEESYQLCLQLSKARKNMAKASDSNRRAPRKFK